MNLRFSKQWKRVKIIKDPSFKINSIVFIENKPFFGSGASDSMVYLWDISGCRKISTLRGHRSAVNKIIFDKKSGNLLSGGEDMNIISWDIEYEKGIRTFRGHSSAISCIDVHPILNILVSGSRDNTIRIWDQRMRKEALIIKYHSNQISSVAFNHESPHLISSGRDSKICLWDLIAFKCINRLILHKNDIKDIKIHPTELKFASLCAQTLNIWRLDGVIIDKLNVSKHTSLFSFKNHDGFVITERSGVMKFYKSENCKKPSSLYYKFFPFKRKSIICPITMEFDSNYSTFIMSSEKSEIGIFKEKWSLQNSTSHSPTF